MNVAVVIYHGVELVDMNGPIDVFIHANRYNNSKYNIYTVAENTNDVLSESEVITIKPNYSIDNCPEPDIIVIPGKLTNKGIPVIADPVIINWIQQMGKKDKLIMSVCIGALSLAKTGLLSGKRATTHYLSINDLKDQYPSIIVEKNVRFVEDGQFVTTGGVTSGIDGALHLVEKFDGPVLAQKVADIMIYNRNAPLPPYTLLPPYSSI